MGLISSAQLFALWGEAWRDLDLEADTLQPLFDAFGHTPGGHLGADAAVR